MSNSIEILISGDTYLGGGRIKDLAVSNSTEALFGNFLTKIQNADISITNLESPVIDNAKPILKTGPNLKSPIRSLTVLKNAGFNLLTLANNHIMDYGVKGLNSTLEACANVGIESVGAGKNFKESQLPFIIEIKGRSLGIINFAENEFSTTNDDFPGAHALNPIKNYYLIKDVQKVVDFLIVIVHGGHESYQLPSPRMKETYRFFVDSGADAVVGHHPHCYSGYEIYKNAPIFYSLGNFLFDNQAPLSSMWNEGFMVLFRIDEEGLSFEIEPYLQNTHRVGLQSLRSEKYTQFLEKISLLNDIITDDMELQKKFDLYCESLIKLYSSYLEPYSLKYLHALRNRNLFPSLLSDRKKRLLLNLTRCEAHRDVLINILEE